MEPQQNPPPRDGKGGKGFSNGDIELVRSTTQLLEADAKAPPTSFLKKGSQDRISARAHDPQPFGSHINFLFSKPNQKMLPTLLDLIIVIIIIIIVLAFLKAT